MSDYFEQAQILYEQQQFDRAIDALRQEIDLHPEHASAHGLLALCLEQQGQNIEAINAIESALTLEPEETRLRYIYAQILWNQQRYEAAATEVDEVIRMDFRKAKSYAIFSWGYYRREQSREALEIIEEALDIDAQYTGFRNLRMIILIQFGQLDQIKIEVQDSLIAAPENPVTHALAGWIELQMNQLSDACNFFQAALHLDRELIWARQGLIEALKARSRFLQPLLSLERKISGLGVESRRTWTTTFQRFLISLLFIFVTPITQPFIRFLLSQEPYGEVLFSRTEIQVNRWHLVGLFTFIISLSFALTISPVYFVLMFGIWTAAYCLWRLYNADKDWESRFKSGFMLSLTTISILVGLSFILPIPREALELPMGFLGILMFLVAFMVFAALIFGETFVRFYWSLKPNKKHPLSSQEIKVNHWHIYGILIAFLGLTLTFIVHRGSFFVVLSVWTICYFFWRCIYIDTSWKARLKSGFYFVLGLLILFVGFAMVALPNTNAVGMVVGIFGVGMVLLFLIFLVFYVMALISKLILAIYRHFTR